MCLFVSLCDRGGKAEEEKGEEGEGEAKVEEEEAGASIPFQFADKWFFLFNYKLPLSTSEC